ncbi:MAG: M28 family peptidase [Candidatus Sumerlaeaceae bacterium]
MDFRSNSPSCLPIAICLLLSCGFAVGQTTSTLSAPARFDGQRAFSDLILQCELGPRLPGSNAHQKTREHILSVLEHSGLTTGSQPFTANSQLLGKSIAGVNLYGTYPKAPSIKYLLSAHYDTRPFADQEKSPEKAAKPVPGANDGASGAAVLLEIARQLPKLNLPHSVGLVFFDLEDHGLPTDSNGFCLGSQFMAKQLPATLQFENGINVDMVGDADLRLPVEGHSMRRAPDLAKRFWDLGARLHPAIFVKQSGPPVHDDHIAFLELGKPYIDIIDFNYPSWHTLGDTVDKCSPESLQAVGDTLLEFIQN